MRGWTPQQIALVRTMRAAGYKNTEITEKLGDVPRSRLCRLIHDLQIPPRPREGGRASKRSRRQFPIPRGTTLPPLPSLVDVP